jgi:hypothetical protein
MARLPSELYLMQQIGGAVVLFEDYTEREIVRFDPGDAGAAYAALVAIRDSDLSGEDKCFAYFWAGYFHGCSGQDDEATCSRAVSEDYGVVTVTWNDAVVARFDLRDSNAVAMAQKSIYDSGIFPLERARAHFWCGVFYAHASGDGDGIRE